MQTKPNLSEEMLQSLDRLGEGIAVAFVAKRVQEVTKISEVDAIWRFLDGYDYCEG